VTFSFKARDSHTWAIEGQVTAGSNTFFPATPATPASGAVQQPGDPCKGGTAPAAISFTPPSPI